MYAIGAAQINLLLNVFACGVRRCPGRRQRLTLGCCRKIAFTLTIRSLDSMNAGRPTQRE
jgi:hypothetical protein